MKLVEAWRVRRHLSVDMKLVDVGKVRFDMSLTEKVIMSISNVEEVVRMVKAEVTRADHQRLIDSVESESSVALLVHFREVTWS